MIAALGIVLIAVAFVSVVAEAHLSTGGLIATAGAVAAIGGVAMLLSAAGLDAILVLIVALCAAVGFGSMLVVARRRILRPLFTRPRTGREALVGNIGVVRAGKGAEPQVFVDGSLWRAEPDPIHNEAELHDGDRVVVERINGLTLRVRKAEEWELNR